MSRVCQMLRAPWSRRPRQWQMALERFHGTSVFLAACTLYRGVASSKYVVLPIRCPVGSSAQNGSALKREFSGGSYTTKRQPMPSPSEGSLSSGGMDQGSDAPARDYDGEVNGPWMAAALSCVLKTSVVSRLICPLCIYL